LFVERCRIDELTALWINVLETTRDAVLSTRSKK
jgi:hypothetical protein